MVEFYKKESWSSFSELNATYRDLYDSVGATMVNRVFKVDGSSGTQDKYGFSSIRGGPQHKKSIFKTKVAERPTFGSAELKRMDAFLYVEDVILEQFSITTPNLVLYKTKPDLVEYTGAGHLKLQENSTKQPGHLTAISAQQQKYISDEEMFNGQDSVYAYNSDVEFVPLGRNLYRKQKPFLEVEDAYKFAFVLGRGGKVDVESGGIMDGPYGKFSRRHSAYTETEGIKSGRRKVVFIRRTTNITFEGNTLWETTKNAKHVQKKYFLNSQIQGILQGMGSEAIDSGANYNNQVTPANSFFSVVGQGREVLVGGTDDKTHLIGTAVSRFSTKNVLSGRGQSMNMYTYWAGTNDISSLAGTDMALDTLYEMYSPDACPNPQKFPKLQTTFACYGVVPFPATQFPAWLNNKYFNGDLTTTTANLEAQGANSAGTIEIDLNLDGLEIAQVYRDDAEGSNQDLVSMVRRSVCVTLGYWKPSSNDNIMSYIGKHFTNSESVPFNGISDNAELKSADTDAYPFLGWTFNRFAGVEQLISHLESDFSSSNQEKMTDGVHMGDLTEGHYVANSGHSSTSCVTCDGQGNADVFVNTDDVQNNYYTIDGDGAPDNAPVPNGWFTMKIMFPAPGDTFMDNRVEVQLCDPKTGKPLPRAQPGSSERERDPDAFSEVSTTTHHLAYTQTMWWTGHTANAGAQSNSSTGLMFPHSATDDGGVSYFAADHSSPTSADRGGGPPHKGAIWPHYLTIWTTNFHNCTQNVAELEDMMLEYAGGYQEKTSAVGVDSSDGIKTTTDKLRRATQSDIYVGGIRLYDFNYAHQNATQSENFSNPQNLLIDSPKLTSMLSGGGSEAWSNIPNNGLGFPGYTVLSFGTDEKNDFDDGTSNDVGIFLNNFQTNLANNVAVPFTRWGMTTGLTTEEDKAYDTGGTFPTSQASNNQLSNGGSFFGNQMMYSQIGGRNVDHSKNFSLDTNVSNTNAIGYTSGTASVDGFTRAGFIQIKGDISEAGTGVGNGDSTVKPELTKRENIACSARVLAVVNKNGGIYKVDTVEPFRNMESDNFIAFLWGSKFRSTTGEVADTDTEGGDGNTTQIDIKVIEIIDSKHVRLSWNGLSQTGEQMTSEHHLPYLFISPYKYWLYGVIQNWEYDTSSGEIKPLPAKTYSSAICTTGDSTSTNHYGAAFGATWNEFLYNDTPTITGSYENKWVHDPDDNNTILDIRDFGFGDYDEEKESGGFVGKAIPKTQQYNQMTMPNIFKVDSTLKAGDDVHFVLDSLNPDSKHEVVFYNNLESAPSGVSLNTNQTDRLPYSLTVFEDTLPETPTLKVVPYEDDPYLPEFQFDASDDDLWYGFIIIDSKPVNTQYHDAILHLPLNDAGSHGKHPSTVPANKAFKYNTDSGTTTETAGMSDSGQLHDIEGLAGNCMRFDGDNDRVVYNPSSGNTLQQLTSEASWVVHFVTDNGAAGINKILDSPQCDLLIDADTGIITTHVYSGASEFVTLTSPAITMDGETPCNAIVTFDKNLKSGNVKLYVDGKLVDQSGLTTSAGPGAGGHNWDKNDDLHASTDDFSVGTSSLSFDGRIEEVVVYKKCIYPVSPSDKKFVLTKNLTEISGGSPLSYSARLFMKDYHNIRGGSSTDVATSPTVSYRKAGFRLVD